MVDGKETYPILAEKAWWELRKKFHQSLPISGVTISYLSTALSLGQKAAGNVRPTLRRLGLIDDEGIITDRAKKWRDNEQYAEVCDEIRTELYPQELRDLFPSPTEDDREAIRRWFANRASVGAAASKMMASFYILLSEANPLAAVEVIRAPRVAKPKKPERVKPETKKPTKEAPSSEVEKETGDIERVLGLPSININIEVHISSDADTTQIDQIFASMAKHLNISRKTSNE